MILARIQGRNRFMLVIGLSGENVTRLAAGEPIFKQLDQFGIASDMVIVYGKTEDDIHRDLDTLVEQLGRTP